ncbi:MAG TPA: isoprenylcysteine carboxylmethyltransferase family protein [Anaeromyxobacter sp.]|nr:isoprenylcysteine carboxylmethyltransferase family protein [Anaeromyxobacter sp.]
MPADDLAILRRKSFAGLASLLLVLAAATFLPAGTLRFWQAWVYGSVFLGCTLLITLHFLRSDPALIQRRLAAGPAAERRPVQRIVQALASLCFLALFVVAGLDHRLGWSSVPAPVSLAADALVAVGFAIVFLVFRENSHASAVIEVSAGQRVVSTGPYRRVRHPMYAGALLLLAATPPALGTLVALPLVAALAAVLVARIVDEERLLSAELPGYRDYCREVRHRLVPHVW